MKALEKVSSDKLRMEVQWNRTILKSAEAELQAKQEQCAKLEIVIEAYEKELERRGEQG